jgi:hypothetical protein
MNTVSQLQKDIEQVIDARLYEIDIASVIGVLEVIKHNIIRMHNDEE